MRCELIVERKSAKTRELLPVGTVFDHDDCFKLVQVGVAKPLDEECREACGMNEEQIAEAIKAQDRVSKGIHPNDFDLYDAGIFIGYNSKGEAVSSDGKVITREEVNAFRKSKKEAPVSYGEASSETIEKTVSTGLEFYESKKLVELREMAGRRKWLGDTSRMKKDELVETLVEDDVSKLESSEL